MKAKIRSSTLVRPQRLLASRPAAVALAFGAFSAVACSSPGAPDVIIIHDSPSGGGAGGVTVGTGGSGPSFVPPNGGSPGSSGGAGSVANGGFTSTNGGSTGSGAGGGSSSATGLPCDVATYFSQKCASCHGNPPIPSAIAALVTYDDLTKTAVEDASKNEAELSLARMKDVARPMPPGAPPSAADIAIVEGWVNAGMPKGSCGSGSDGDGGVAPPPPPPASVFDGAPAFATRAGPRAHNAGRDCMSCHDGSVGGGGEDTPPLFSFGGTLYDGAGAAVSGAEVRLVDATGKAVSVYTGSNGTFYSRTSFAAPAHVGVRNATTKMDMFTALGAKDGGCSSCHCTGSACSVSPLHLP